MQNVTFSNNGFEIILADLENFLTCTKIEPRANEKHICKKYAPYVGNEVLPHRFIVIPDKFLSNELISGQR